jgi:hypothetical protein
MSATSVSGLEALRRRRFNIAAMAALVVLIGAAPATGDVLFTDLGPAGNVYNGNAGWVEAGGYGAGPYAWAVGFTVSGAGNFAVSQIDLAVLNIDQANTFYTSIWTAGTGAPRAQIPGAYWSLSTPYSAGSCCGLVSVTGITGVSLTGGKSYFLVLGPTDPYDDNIFAWNSQGVTGLQILSSDGGSTWPVFGWPGVNQTIGAFDILGATPEPDSFLALGIGVASIMAARRLRSRQPSCGKRLRSA